MLVIGFHLETIKYIYFFLPQKNCLVNNLYINGRHFKMSLIAIFTYMIYILYYFGQSMCNSFLYCTLFYYYYNY